MASEKDSKREAVDKFCDDIGIDIDTYREWEKLSDELEAIKKELNSSFF